MSMHWFRVPTGSADDVQTLAAQLQPFGVVLRPPSPVGCVVFRDFESGALVKEIGDKFLLRSGECRTVPRRDASPAEVMLLLRSAGLAVRERPSKATGWEPRRRGGTSWWRATVLRDVDDGEDVAFAFRCAQPVPAWEPTPVDVS